MSKTSWWFWPSALIIGVMLGLTTQPWQSARVAAQEAKPAPEPTVDPTWEMVTYSGSAVIRRTRVPTGWIVIVGTRPMMVSDPKHQWLNVELEKTTFGSYVAADRATFEALKPELQNYMRYVAKDPKKSRVQKTLNTWNARLKAAELDNR